MSDTHDDGVYADEEYAESTGQALHAQRGDSSDEVDPRKLVRDPTLSEIRWYYRRTFAKVLVDKPIDDAFKNGFEFRGDRAAEADQLLAEPYFDGEGDGFVGAYRLAEKKARRDGFALVFLGTTERGSAGLHDTPIDDDVDVDNVSHVKVLTVDDLSEIAPHDQIAEATGLEEQQYEVRNTGIVVNTDVSSPDFRTPIGYVLDQTEPQFIHRDRVIHLTWNPEVDGDYDDDGVRRYELADNHTTLGQYEGDSILIPSYDLLKGIAKGNWSIMQALFRNASHMYTVTLPTDADDNDMDQALGVTSNINAKSALVFPDGYEVDQHESGNELEPQEYFDVIFNQVCAGQEMTKSVLFGTQAGTVSGSETDIKNYFNKVERYRSNRGESKIIEYLTRASKMKDNRTSTDYQFDIEINWGPMFKVDRDTRIKMMQNEAQALTTLVGNFALTPTELREIMSEDFAELDLGEMTEEKFDVLDRINLTRSGQGPSAERAEEEIAEGPDNRSASAQAAEGGEEGGMQQGQQQASANPTSDVSHGSTSSDDPTSDVGDNVLTQQLQNLAELHDDGALTDDEFAEAKAELLA
jgi:hypothetical protein